MSVPRPEDERAVRQTIAAAEAAWNAGDATAFAATMTDDVDFVSLLGERYHGREIVVSGHKHILSTIYKDSRVVYSPEVVRFLKADIALAIVHQKMTSHLTPDVVVSTARQRQMSPDLHESQARATMVIVNNGGRWLIKAFHNTNVAAAGPLPATS